jgi:ketosteroid isomerase-like protein
MTAISLLSTSRQAGEMPDGAPTTQDVAAVKRLLAAFNRGDLSALDEVDPEAEFQDEPRIPGAGWNHGHGGAVRWAVKLWQAFGRLSLDIDEPIARSGCVIASWHASGVGKRSGIPVDMDGYCVFCMHRHKVSRVEFFETKQAALSAARRIGRQMHEAASGSMTMGAGGFEPPTSRV